MRVIAEQPTTVVGVHPGRRWPIGMSVWRARGGTARLRDGRRRTQHAGREGYRADDANSRQLATWQVPLADGFRPLLLRGHLFMIGTSTLKVTSIGYSVLRAGHDRRVTVCS